MKEMNEQQQSADDTIMEISSKDDKFHDTLGSLHNKVMNKMRYRILRVKKRNGGLTPTEEQELILLEGC